MIKAGKMLATVGSILMLLYGAASFLAILLSLFQPGNDQYALSDHLKMSLPVLSVTVLLVKCALFLFTGAYGLLRIPAVHSPRFAYLLCALSLIAAVADTVLSLLLGSAADTAIITMQDILDLGADARMNTPSTMGGNWTWRLGSTDVFSDELAAKLLKIAKTYSR